MKAIVLRFDAPLMSFGGVTVDHHGVIDRFPGTAMLCGLLGNALGWGHAEYAKLQELQDRIAFAARWDVSPVPMVDYHTVDIGSAHMKEAGWTTHGAPEHRGGGVDAKYGTHQRLRHYWCNGLMTVVLSLTGSSSPTVEDLAAAIRSPARPLFLGRKTCLPARPLLDPVTPLVEGDTLKTMLATIAVWQREDTLSRKEVSYEVCWPGSDADDGGAVMQVHDLRDWQNQVMRGTTLRAEGRIGRADVGLT